MSNQRYDDAQLGMFLSDDPVAAREKGDNFNRYAYAFNNPYRFTDPTGREAGASRVLAMLWFIPAAKSDPSLSVQRPES